MADTKTTAMNEAKDAALDSIGFVLSATKTQSVQLKKSSLLAARNVVAVRKNLVSLVTTFKTYQNTIKQIQAVVGKGGDANSKVSKISGILQSGGDAYKEKEAEQEDKPKATELVKGIGKNVATAAGSALALAIPFLLSPEMREMLMSFFSGFLEGLGLGKDALDKVKLGFGIAAGILIAYFSASVISSIAGAFMQMQKLAQVLGLAGEVVSAEKTKIDTEKDKVKQAGKGTKAELDSAKKDMKKNSKGNLLKRLGVLKNTLGPKLLKLGKNFLKALPIVGTVLGIGLILYDLFDIGKDVWNFLKGEETTDAEDKQNTEQEDAAPVSATSAPASAAASAPAAAEAEIKAPTSNTSAAEMTSASSAPVAAEPADTPRAEGMAIQESSVKVEQADSDLARTAGGVNITTIDNSTTIMSSPKSATAPPSTLVYSVTVGM